MSQVTIGGGDSATCGLLPRLTSFIGAGVPHSWPSRIGSSGTTTTWRPFSRAAQRACASSTSCGAHWATAGTCASALPGRTNGHCDDLTADRATTAGGVAVAGAAPCANAPGVATTQHTAAAAKRLLHIEDLPLVSARGPGT